MFNHLYLAANYITNSCVSNGRVGLCSAAKADLPVRNEHRQDECPKNKPSKFITTRCSFSKVAWLQESTSFGGHKIPKGGHRKVSGIVRAKVREEIRREIEDANDNSQ